jgi:GAF domain-containing protein
MEKQQKYQKIRESLDDFLVSYSPKIDNLGIMATLNSLVKTFFPDIIFVGFYLVRLVQNRKVLEIGPYQGNVLACARIEMGDGVCGIAAEKKEVQIVSNVFDFPGYIACDAETKSEIVIPVIKDGEVVAVFDLDHGEIGYFEQVDQVNLENLLSYLD